MLLSIKKVSLGIILVIVLLALASADDDDDQKAEKEEEEKDPWDKSTDKYRHHLGDSGAGTHSEEPVKIDVTEVSESEVHSERSKVCKNCKLKNVVARKKSHSSKSPPATAAKDATKSAEGKDVAAPQYFDKNEVDDETKEQINDATDEKDPADAKYKEAASSVTKRQHKKQHHKGKKHRIAQASKKQLNPQIDYYPGNVWEYPYPYHHDIKYGCGENDQNCDAKIEAKEEAKEQGNLEALLFPNDARATPVPQEAKIESAVPPNESALPAMSKPEPTGKEPPEGVEPHPEPDHAETTPAEVGELSPEPVSKLNPIEAKGGMMEGKEGIEGKIGIEGKQDLGSPDSKLATPPITQFMGKEPPSEAKGLSTDCMQKLIQAEGKEGIEGKQDKKSKSKKKEAVGRAPDHTGHHKISEIGTSWETPCFYNADTKKFSCKQLIPSHYYGPPSAGWGGFQPGHTGGGWGTPHGNKKCSVPHKPHKNCRQLIPSHYYGPPSAGWGGFQPGHTGGGWGTPHWNKKCTVPHKPHKNCRQLIPVHYYGPPSAGWGGFQPGHTGGGWGTPHWNKKCKIPHKNCRQLIPVHYYGPPSAGWGGFQPGHTGGGWGTPHWNKKCVVPHKRNKYCRQLIPVHYYGPPSAGWGGFQPGHTGGGWGTPHWNKKCKVPHKGNKHCRQLIPVHYYGPPSAGWGGFQPGHTGGGWGTPHWNKRCHTPQLKCKSYSRPSVRSSWFFYNPREKKAWDPAAWYSSTTTTPSSDEKSSRKKWQVPQLRAAEFVLPPSTANANDRDWQDMTVKEDNALLPTPITSSDVKDWPGGVAPSLITDTKEPADVNICDSKAPFDESIRRIACSRFDAQGIYQEAVGKYNSDLSGHLSVSKGHEDETVIDISGEGKAPLTISSDPPPSLNSPIQGSNNNNNNRRFQDNGGGNMFTVMTLGSDGKIHRRNDVASTSQGSDNKKIDMSTDAELNKKEKSKEPKNSKLLGKRLKDAIHEIAVSNTTAIPSESEESISPDKLKAALAELTTSHFPNKSKTISTKAKKIHHRKRKGKAGNLFKSHAGNLIKSHAGSKMSSPAIANIDPAHSKQNNNVESVVDFKFDKSNGSNINQRAGGKSMPRKNWGKIMFVKMVEACIRIGKPVDECAWRNIAPLGWRPGQNTQNQLNQDPFPNPMIDPLERAPMETAGSSEQFNAYNPNSHNVSIPDMNVDVIGNENWGTGIPSPASANSANNNFFTNSGTYPFSNQNSNIMSNIPMSENANNIINSIYGRRPMNNPNGMMGVPLVDGSSNQMINNANGELEIPRQVFISTSEHQFSSPIQPHDSSLPRHQENLDPTISRHQENLDPTNQHPILSDPANQNNRDHSLMSEPQQQMDMGASEQERQDQSDISGVLPAQQQENLETLNRLEHSPLPILPQQEYLGRQYNSPSTSPQREEENAEPKFQHNGIMDSQQEDHPDVSDSKQQDHSDLIDSQQEDRSGLLDSEGMQQEDVLLDRQQQEHPDSPNAQEEDHSGLLNSQDHSGILGREHQGHLSFSNPQKQQHVDLSSTRAHDRSDHGQTQLSPQHFAKHIGLSSAQHPIHITVPSHHLLTNSVLAQHSPMSKLQEDSVLPIQMQSQNHHTHFSHPYVSNSGPLDQSDLSTQETTEYPALPILPQHTEADMVVSQNQNVYGLPKVHQIHHARVQEHRGDSSLHRVAHRKIVNNTVDGLNTIDTLDSAAGTLDTTEPVSAAEPLKSAKHIYLKNVAHNPRFKYLATQVQRKTQNPQKNVSVAEHFANGTDLAAEEPQHDLIEEARAPTHNNMLPDGPDKIDTLQDITTNSQSDSNGLPSADKEIQLTNKVAKDALNMLESKEQEVLTDSNDVTMTESKPSTKHVVYHRGVPSRGVSSRAASQEITGAEGQRLDATNLPGAANEYDIRYDTDGIQSDEGIPKASVSKLQQQFNGTVDESEYSFAGNRTVER